MADQTIKVKVTGFTYLQGDKNHAVINTQNVQVNGIFWWDALNEFFNKEKNITAIEQQAIMEVPSMKEFTAEFDAQLIDDVESGHPHNISYEIEFPVSFEITGDYQFAGDENNYNEESV